MAICNEFLRPNARATRFGHLDLAPSACTRAINLSKAGWSWGCVSALDLEGRTIWIADAHRDDGKRFVVQADEKLTAFLELESAICACGEVAAAVLQRNATAAIANVARVIASCSYHFVVAAWSTKSC